MKSHAHKAPYGHLDPGHGVPAGVGRCVGRCPGERPGVPGGGSLGILKTERFWDAVWDAFWMAFGGPDPPELSSRVGETLMWKKSPFSPKARFLMKSQDHKAPEGHQDPGHGVPAGVGVGRCVGRCLGERPGVPGGGSLGIFRTERFWNASWDA